MNLFSVLIADRMPAGAPVLSPAIERNIASLREHHPGLPHRLFDQEAIRAFLRTHMEPDVCWAYEQLLPYAYRADLARLCLLHQFGGLYADLSVFFHAPLPVEAGKMIVFRDRAHVAPWIVSNTILGAPPRAPALEAAIRMIVAHCRARYRGVSSLCPTGPVLLGKAIAMHCEPDQIHMGEVSNALQSDTSEALVFVDTVTRRLIGYRAKDQAGLAQLGLTEGVNNYNDFYRAGVIYAADFPVLVGHDYLRRHAHRRATADADGLRWESDAAATALETIVLCRLPMPFAAGRYRVLLAVADSGDGSAITLLASAHDSGAQLARLDQRLAPGADIVAALPLDIPASRNDIVIGVLAAAGASLRITGLRIERCAHELTP